MVLLFYFLSLLLFAKPLLTAREVRTTNLDLNRSPPPSSSPSESNVNLQSKQDEELLKESQSNVPEQEEHKKSRKQKRQYNFPPGTTRDERRRIYKNTFYATMVS